jgi:hypothetical protein
MAFLGSCVLDDPGLLDDTCAFFPATFIRKGGVGFGAGLAVAGAGCGKRTGTRRGRSGSALLLLATEAGSAGVTTTCRVDDSALREFVGIGGRLTGGRPPMGTPGGTAKGKADLPPCTGFRGDFDGD